MGRRPLYPDLHLAPEVAAKRLLIATVDLADLGRPWTQRDVIATRKQRPEWLTAALAAVAEEKRERAARREVAIARRAEVGFPAITAEASRFAREFGNSVLLRFLYEAVDCSAADTEVVVSGRDGSVYGRSADETNRERAARGAALSSTHDHPCGSLGDLFSAPTGNTYPTFVSGYGMAADWWGRRWREEYLWMDDLVIGYELAGLVLAGDVDTLEVIAGSLLGDTDVYGRNRTFSGIPAEVMSLADAALEEWYEHAGPIADPDELVDMNAPVSTLPAMILACRHDWSVRERLAVALSGGDDPAGADADEDVDSASVG